MDLKNAALSSVLWDVLGLLGNQGVSFVVSMMLARLLTPSEFGVVGIAMAFIAVTQILIDGGFSDALIQKQDVDEISYSSVFYINTGLGLVLFVIFQLSAEIISSFFSEPELKGIIQLLSFSLIAGSLSKIHNAILIKELRFKEISIRNLVAGGISGIVGVILAYRGFGAYAIVIQHLVSTAIITILIWNMTRWMPKWEFSISEIRELWKFGAYVFLQRSTSKLIQRSKVFFVAKIFDSATLGYFTRSESLTQLINKYASSSIQRVFFPTMSRLQEDRAKYRATFLKSLKLVSFGSFLLSGMMILSGKAIILGLFGPQWGQSVAIFQILMLRIFNYPINVLCNGALLASGQSKVNFWKGNINKLLILLSFLVAYQYGFIAFLWSMVVLSHITVGFNIYFVYRYLKVHWMTQIRHIYISGLIFLACILPIWFMVFLGQEGMMLYVTSFIKSLTFAISYVTILFMIDRSLRDMIYRLIGDAKKLIL